MLRKYHLVDSVVVEEKPEEIVLRPNRRKAQKLSWPETAKQMAASAEDWSDWESTTADGLE
ncbi:MAG: hypothetical protein AVDCRST_MAG42-1631 [uncultured Chthoniobacterales bacterium]|uniref:Uncharacterized protein n=1 Tax=uncultured Chthoniobacterales bacterium TaxID=1836801 RepID=A0A6J4I3V3_9BACT|nr:MAG: hypothetical protein AVDCRST_MAG42-1631 [uncultured Chthoniobacterales bacterium]